MTRKLEHGAVWLADLNPQRGSEPGKTRPVLIIQNQALLDAGHPSTLVIPLTTRLIEDAAPLRLRISARDRLDRDSDLLIDQIRAIDNQRLVTGPLTLLGAGEMSRIYSAILEVMGIELNPRVAFSIHES
jgi:mRNA interferase MazF